MTVTELIAKLQEFEPTVEVVIDDADTGYQLTVQYVEADHPYVSIGGDYDRIARRR